MFLDKERGDLTKAIELTKLRISQAEGMIDTQQQKIAESDKAIALLEQSLSSSREGEESAKSQLSEQKMRVVTLETFIQNYALSHTRKLDVIKEGQKGLIESITTGLHAVTRDSTNHKDAVLLAIRDAFEDFRSSLLSLHTKLSVEQEDATKFTLKAQEVISR
jgi:chromosome segregation ATPase